MDLINREMVNMAKGSAYGKGIKYRLVDIKWIRIDRSNVTWQSALRLKLPQVSGIEMVAFASTLVATGKLRASV